MNIEQIADAVSQEMLMHVATLQPELVKWNREYLRRCLSKLAKQDVEPVACYNPNTDEAEDAFNWYCNTGRSDSDYPVALYTKAQLLAAQQRTADACAKVCDSIDAAASSNPPVLCAMTIRNGYWREYL